MSYHNFVPVRQSVTLTIKFKSSSSVNRHCLRCSEIFCSAEAFDLRQDSHLLTLLTMNTKREKQRERSVNRPMIPDSTLWHKHNVSRHGFNCGRKYMTEKSASTCYKETRTPLSLVFIFILFIVYNFCGCLFIILNPFGKL